MLILFDLDGTLTDPARGITGAVVYALRHYGIEVRDRRTLYPFIGPPLTDSFEKYFGFSHEKAVEAVEVYRVYFRERGIFENAVYPGVPEMLEGLQACGRTLCVASSKPEVFVRRILDHFGLSRYFSEAVGSELDGRRVRKDEVVAEALARCGAGTETVVGGIGSTTCWVRMPWACPASGCSTATAAGRSSKRPARTPWRSRRRRCMRFYAGLSRRRDRT